MSVHYSSQGHVPLNKGLLDARNTGRLFVDLKDAFYPVEFFDLCSIIEEIVLRDEIVLVGKFDRLPIEYKRALKPFIDAGVFKICIEAFEISKGVATDPELRALALQARNSNLTSTSILDSDYAVTRLLGAEVSLRIPTVPLLQHMQNFQFFRRPSLDHAVCDLVGRYSDLKERLARAKELDFHRLGLRPLSVPPIPLQAIQQAHNFEKLREVILDTRDRFSYLRTEMRTLAHIMADPELSSSRFYQLISSWEAKWNNLAQSHLTNVMQIGQSTDYLLAGGKELARAYKYGATPATLATGIKIAGAMGKLFGSMSLRPVHLSVRNFMHSHPHQIITAVSRVFQCDPALARRRMEAVGGVSSNVWRTALAKLNKP